MANYTPSNYVKAQARLIQAFQNNELRYRVPATFLEYLKNTQIMIPSYQELRTREDRSVSAYFKNRTSRSLGSARTHNHTGTKGDSTELALSWTSYVDEFSISLKQGDNNIFSWEDQFMGEVENVLANFANGLESAAAAHLFASRSGVNVAAVEGSFDGTDDVFHITESTNGERAMQITKAVMDINAYKGSYTIFCDTVSYNKFQYQANQGTANTANLSFQFGGATFVHTPDLNADAAALTTPITKGFWIAVPNGSIAALPWIPKQNRNGVDLGSVANFGTLMNPIDGLDYALHSYFEGSDQSAVNGNAQDVLFQYEVSIDVAFDYAPLTTADETPIQAFGLV